MNTKKDSILIFDDWIVFLKHIPQGDLQWLVWAGPFKSKKQADFWIKKQAAPYPELRSGRKAIVWE